MAASMTLTPNYTTIGVLITHLTSDDSNQSIQEATIEYKLSAAGTWETGHVVKRITSTRLLGSVLYVEPGTAYDVRVTFSDSGDTLDGVTVSASTTTRSYPTVPASPTRTRYVSPSGSGTTYSSGTPGSLTVALADAAADDKIICLAGTYYVGDLTLSASGSSGNEIVVIADDGANVIFSGADSASLTWTNAGTYDGQPMYKTTTSGYANTGLVGINGARLMAAVSLNDCKAFTAYDVACFWHDGVDTLYVHQKDGGNPGDDTVVVSKRNRFAKITGDYWIFKNIKFQHYGHAGAEWPTALHIADAENITVDGCTFTLCNRALYVDGACHKLTVQNCTFQDDVSLLTWSAVKSSAYKNLTDSYRIGTYESVSTILCSSKRPMPQQLVVRNCTFVDLFDGVELNSNGNVADGPMDWDFIDNTITNVEDDGIEIDGYAANVRVINNTFRDCAANVFSMAKAHTGPVYLVRNTASQIGSTVVPSSLSSGTKFNSSDTVDVGWLFVYHNTIDAGTDVTGKTVTAIRNAPATSTYAGDSFRGVVCRNNIFFGSDFAVDIRADSSKWSMDYDCVIASGSSLARWGSGVYATLAAFQAGASQEAHGVSVDPYFSDRANGDYRLTSGSPLLDAGVAINGINDTWASTNIGSKQTTTSTGPGTGGGGGTMTTGAWTNSGTTNAYLDLDSAIGILPFPYASPYTALIFFRWDGTTTDQGVLWFAARTGSFSIQTYLRLNNTASPSNTLTLYMPGGTTTTTGGVIEQDKWYLASVVNTGADDGSAVTIYAYEFDGVDTWTQVAATTGDEGSGPDRTVETVRLSQRRDASNVSNDEFSGDLALFAYLDTALSSTDIETYLANPFTFLEDNAADVVAYWDFNGDDPQTDTGSGTYAMSTTGSGWSFTDDVLTWAGGLSAAVFSPIEIGVGIGTRIAF